MTDETLSRLASELLGPETVRALAGPEAEETFDMLRSAPPVGRGVDPTDAMLSLAFDAARTNRQVQGEFLAFFRGLLFGPGAEGLESSPDLDHTDLMQSVVGDLLPDFHALYFESRGQFLSLMRLRLRWKRLDRIRGQRPSAVAPDELARLEDEYERWTEDHGPLSRLISSESEARITLALASLEDHHRQLLRAVMDGRDRVTLAEELGITLDSLRQRIHRARLALEAELER